ncbi:RHS repeat-associated protein [Tahibacter aquaticus]|uniref:RHS repeat-associated protein n=1 Tax=Tahibacter aquaticus TaxID=520092 RepID=A0A4V3DNB1_9GAMM|nr:RHS repeat-associated core domain-containing protein [Tahibacter aquaticus]TDR47756.1 RHS repeat-associated protein [Tahibacter aquaticus]
MNGIDRSWPRLTGAAIWLVALFALLAAAPTKAMDDLSLPEAQLLCSPSVNTDSWLSGVALAQPGRWWNPKRYGSGWDLVYNDERTKLKAFMYTFNANGHSTWLATKMVDIAETGDRWKAQLYEYTESSTGVISSMPVGEVGLVFFRDDPSRVGLRWRWLEVQTAGLMPAGYVDECLSDMTRLNPTYYAWTNGAIETQEVFDKELTVDPSVSQVFSGYWNKPDPGNPAPDVDEVPGVVMTVMQASLGGERGKFGEAAVRLLFNKVPPAAGGNRKPIFVQAQRVSLLSNLPLSQDTFNLYFHYGVGYPNGYPLNDCSTSTECNDNILVGTYTRSFKPETNYRSAHTEFFIDTTKLNNGKVPGAPTINGVATPAYLLTPSSTSADPPSQTILGEVTRTNRLQEISVNQYVCQVLPPATTCSICVSWAGNGIGKAWRRNLGTLTYGAAPIDSADFGYVEQILNHGDRVQFELWQGIPGQAGAVLLDKAPEVRAVGPTPGENGFIQVPAAPVISNLDDLSLGHDASVGALAGEAGVSGGAGTYSVPIAVPPGRNGMAPSVGLSYNSRGGNGVAGLGWSLDAGGAVTRCPRTLDQDSTARGVRMDGDDRLCLDGQRLVAIVGTGAYGAAGTGYRTEIDSFAKVVQSGAGLASGNVCFTVEYKDGRKSSYGCAPSGSSCAGVAPRVQPAGLSPLREQAWLLSRVEDRTGNFMDYCYVSGEAGSGEVLLDQIRYTGSTLAGTTSAQSIPTRKIKFDYEPRPTWDEANDRSSSSLAGGTVQQTRRLTKISTYSPDSSAPARSYMLGYSDTFFSGKDYSNYSGRSLLRRITECGQQAGSGAETCSNPTEFTWSDGNWEFASRKFAVSASPGRSAPQPAPMPDPVWQEDGSSAATPEYRRQSTVPTGDLDGDGTREMLTTIRWFDGVWRSEYQLSKVTADRVTKGTVTFTDFPVGEVSDIDGDGIAEIVSGNKIYKWKGGRGADACGGGAASCTASANSYFSVVTTNIPSGGTIAPQGIADFNADGAPDVLVRLPPLSICDAGSGGGDNERVGNAPKGTVPNDYAVLCVLLNLKPGTISTSTTTFNFGTPKQVDLLYAGIDGEAVQHVTDFNGDGTADVIVADSNGAVVRAVFSQLNGTALSFAAQTSAQLNLDPSTRYLRWMDINGDGLDDAVIAHLPGAGGSCEGQPCPFGAWKIQLNKGGTMAAVAYPVGPSGNPSPGLRYSGSQGGVAATRPQFRYFSKMIQTDIDSDGRADLLYPAHFAARMCFKAYLAPNLFLPARPAEDCPEQVYHGSTCLADVCAAPPPEDGSTYSEHPGTIPSRADAFSSGLGEFDPSSYKYNVIRFVQTGANTFRLQVDETPIIAGNSVLGSQRGRADDYFGDGLADVVGDAGCPFKRTLHYPENTCELAAGGTAGPGSSTSYLDTAQTIQLGSLVNPDVVNLVLNENRGDGVRTNLAPMFPDMMVKATDALGDQASWDYFPLSSSAGRGSDFPLYKIDADYVDSRHFLFQSSMPVVAVLGRSNGAVTGSLAIFGGRSQRYAYEGAMYNSGGRGFQGFRKISAEGAGPTSRIVRTATTFHQKFPLTGRIESIETRLPGVSTSTGLLSLETFDWRCNLSNITNACPGQDGNAPAHTTIYWPFLNASSKFSYDLAAAEAGTQFPLGQSNTFNYEPNSTASGWSQYGNLRYTRTVSKDGNGNANGDKYFVAAHETITVNNYDTSIGPLGQWWFNKLLSSTTSTTVSYHPRSGTAPSMDLSQKTLVTSYSWNTANRTLSSKTITDSVAGQSFTTSYAYPTPNLGSPTSASVTGSGISAPREVQTAYSNDGYFPASVTAVLSTVSPSLNHVTTTTTRASDGQPTSTTDPNGLKTTNEYDQFGRPTAQLFFRTDGVTPAAPTARVALQKCLPCGGVGSGEEMAVYYATTVKDGAPSQRTWFDMLGREVKRASRGFDGRWVNVTTKYDNMTTVISSSAPYYTGESPLLTQFTYDRFNRVRSKRVPTAELNATQGDTVSNYSYVGLRTDIAVAPLNVNCTATPTLCIAVKRHSNSLGQLMRTEDALAGSYPAGSLQGITDYWLNPGGAVAAIRDGKGSVISAVYSALGHRLSSHDPNQGNWSFTYNALGEMLTQTDARGVQTTVTQRDSLGRVLQQRREPVLGVPATLADQKILDTWQYDPPGAKGQLAQQQRQRSLTVGSPDGSTPIWTESYSYWADTTQLFQRVTAIEPTTPGAVQLTHEYHYDPYYGYLSSVSYLDNPQPLTVWKRYTRYGSLSGIVDARLMTPMWSMTEADAYGKPTKEQFGYALYGNASYSRATGQMRSQAWRLYEVPTVTGNVDEFAYSYDSLGNLASQERIWRRYESGYANTFISSLAADPQGRTVETYAYDKLQRLTSVNRTRGQGSGSSWVDMPVVPTTVSYGYDAVGNITAKSDFAASYTYGGLPGDSCGPNALKSTSDPASSPTHTSVYQCDANGNQTSEVGSGTGTQNRTIVYDGANLPTRIDHRDTWIANSQIDYHYGPDNARFKRTGENVTLFYGADGYEREVTNGGQTALHRIELGPVVYTRSVTGTPPGTVVVSPSITNYQLRDRLGSTIAVADRWGHFNGVNTGTPAYVDGLMRRSYDPFGMPREPGLGGVTRPNNYTLPTLQLGPATRRGFTDHEHIDTVKLIHMNGRGYDYRSGRFLSVDPIIQFPTNSQSLNPYSYILNNPLSGTDPSGYAVECEGWDGCSFDGKDVNNISVYEDTETGERFAVASTGDGGLYRIESINVTESNGADVTSTEVYNASKSGNASIKELNSRRSLFGKDTGFVAKDFIREQSNRHGVEYLSGLQKLNEFAAGCAITGGARCVTELVAELAGVPSVSSGELRQMPNAQQFPNLFPEDQPRAANIIPNEKLRTISQKGLAYVVKTDGTLVVGRNNTSQGHIDLAGGEPVLAAGEVSIHAGRIKLLDNSSGHYRPSGPGAQYAAEDAFRRNGFEVEGIYTERAF